MTKKFGIMGSRAKCQVGQDAEHGTLTKAFPAPSNQSCCADQALEKLKVRVGRGRKKLNGQPLSKKPFDFSYFPTQRQYSLCYKSFTGLYLHVCKYRPIFKHTCSHNYCQIQCSHPCFHILMPSYLAVNQKHNEFDNACGYKCVLKYPSF